MSRLFPTSHYAEDQPLSGLILTTHVFHRGFQLGAFLGILSSPIPLLYRRFFPSTHTQNQKVTSTSTTTTALPKPATLIGQQARGASFWTSKLLPHTGVGGLVGFTAMAVMLPLKMRGKEPIEWQDRAWRLLANQGQVEVDEWSLAGIGAGIAGAMWARRRGMEVSGWRGAVRVVGGAGVGSLVGVGVWGLWRGLVGKGE